MLRVRAPIALVEREEGGGGSGTDTALVGRVLSGERLAFAELYRRHVVAIYDFSFHRLGNREAAEDATQAVFMRAIGSLADCRRPEAFRSWLFGIARHVVMDVYRANTRRSVAIDLAIEVEDRSPSPERLAFAAEEHARVRRAQARLNADERELLDLLQQELTDKEIATILGKRHGAVRTAHYRLRRKLRALIGDVNPGEAVLP